MKIVIVLKHASSRAHAPLPRSVLHIGPPPLCRRASSVCPVLWEEKGVERVAQARFRRHPLDATLFACLHGRPTSPRQFKRSSGIGARNGRHDAAARGSKRLRTYEPENTRTDGGSAALNERVSSGGCLAASIRRVWVF